MKKEIWKKIIGFEDYNISSIGRVYSNKTNKILKQQPSHNGYLRVCLYDSNHQQHTEIVHRLLAFSFIGEDKEKPQINHKNGIKQDNRLENIEWVTSKENIAHSWSTGLKKAQKGENHPSNKLKEKEVLQILHKYKQGITQRKIAEQFNICFQNVNSIVKGKIWKHLTT